VNISKMVSKELQRQREKHADGLVNLTRLWLVAGSPKTKQPRRWDAERTPVGRPSAILREEPGHYNIKGLYAEESEALEYAEFLQQAEPKSTPKEKAPHRVPKSVGKSAKAPKRLQIAKPPMADPRPLDEILQNAVDLIAAEEGNSQALAMERLTEQMRNTLDSLAQANIGLGARGK
jgi:hypothetical protein